MTLVLLTALKIRVKTTKMATTRMWTVWRRRSAERRGEGLPSMSSRSMQTDVVRAVRAESTLEKAAAVMPRMKSTVTVMPNQPCCTSMGKRVSLWAGTAMPCRLAKV